METIQCTVCLEYKEATKLFFRQDKKKTNGFHSWCKACLSRYETKRQKDKGITPYKKYVKNNHEKVAAHNAQNRERNRLIRLEVIKHYSNGSFSCKCCGETNQEFLAVDHTHGNGNKERKELKLGSGSPFFRYLRKNNYPEGYRVLCHNCNMSFGCYGYCPHQKENGNEQSSP